MARKLQSFDELVAKQSVIVADQIKAATDWADSEMDLHIEVERALEGFKKEAKIKFLKGRHNHTIGTGRPDSVYGCVIIEYKKPGEMAERKDAPGNLKVVEQLKRRFYDFRTEERKALNTMFGVGTDGRYFIFLRFRDDKWDEPYPVEVDRYSTQKFLWALYNLGQKGKAFHPNYLALDFGAEHGGLAQRGVKKLYHAIRKTKDPKALVFFDQWKLLFGEVCGYDIDSPSTKIAELGKTYDVGLKPDPAPLLFALQTYYALFIKLLAGEIINFFHKLPSPLKTIINAPSPAKFKHALEQMEEGGMLKLFNIFNFLEGDLFSWYLSAWDEDIEGVVREMVERLDEYNPGTMSEEPEVSRDLLKRLYQELFPKKVRHDLGEYFTPDWLAEHVLNELEYEGDPDKSLLDPACGTGTFLVQAITRIRKWYEDNRENVPYGESELVKKILNNVIGFDLNPLAVMAARTNYLIAIRDLIHYVDRIELPIYLSDSIMVPSEYGELFSSAGEAISQLGVKELPTSVGRFLVPTEIANDRNALARYTEILEKSVSRGDSSNVFIKRCQDEDLPVKEENLHIELYDKLVKLDEDNKNGIWARIIKNYFAPLFIEPVDYIAGNPPWVNYENLSPEYQKITEPVWNYYNLFLEKGWRGRFAKGNADFSMLFTYSCLDNYLKPSGRLGFVITQSVFQAKDSGTGFRRFQINDSHLQIKKVDDMVALKPFEANNRTAAFTIDLTNQSLEYPIEYIEWRLKPKAKVSTDMSLPEVLQETKRENKFAWPIEDKTSPWVILSKGLSADTIHKITRGRRFYRAWKGSDTRGANAIFWLRILKKHNNDFLVENTPDLAKKKANLVQKKVEDDLVYPLLRGKEVSKWRVKPELAILFPHQGEAAIPQDELKRRWPKTYDYLKEFYDFLKSRKMYDLGFRELEFYSLFKTGDFLISPYKVVWKYIASGLICSVVGKKSDSNFADKVIIPDHKLVITSFDEPNEAHYVCALLNSTPARYVVKCYAVKTQISTHVHEFVKVPKYKKSNTIHYRLNELSQQAHELVINNKDCLEVENEIDDLAAKVWHLTKEELRTMKRLI